MDIVRDRIFRRFVVCDNLTKIIDIIFCYKKIKNIYFLFNFFLNVIHIIKKLLNPIETQLDNPEKERRGGGWCHQKPCVGG